MALIFTAKLRQQPRSELIFIFSFVFITKDVVYEFNLKSIIDEFVLRDLSVSILIQSFKESLS